MRKCCSGRTALWTLAAVAGLVGFGYFFGHSYVSTAVHKAVHRFSREVPPEFEIDRIHHELAQLESDVRKNLDAVAEEIVAVQNLEKNIDTSRVSLDKQKKIILTMKTDLETGAKTVKYGGRNVNASDVRDSLAREFEAFKRAEEALKAKELLLKEKKSGLDAAKEQISQMRSVKEQLEIELARLQADLQRVRVVETKSKFQIDDSRLSHIKSSMRDLHDRIEAIKVRHELDADFTHEALINKVEQKTKSNEVLKEIDAHFGGEADNVAGNK